MHPGYTDYNVLVHLIYQRPSWTTITQPNGSDEFLVLKSIHQLIKSSGKRSWSLLKLQPGPKGEHCFFCAKIMCAWSVFFSFSVTISRILKFSLNIKSTFTKFVNKFMPYSKSSCSRWSFGVWKTDFSQKVAVFFTLQKNTSFFNVQKNTKESM